MTASLAVHQKSTAFADDEAEGSDTPVPDDDARHYCLEDGETWPCWTVRALEAHRIVGVGYVVTDPEPGLLLRPATYTLYVVCSCSGDSDGYGGGTKIRADQYVSGHLLGLPTTPVEGSS